uniref:Immunoglobulin domain-containing protein n=1 Tax=Myripristis murdjan TaxID=586833 RepID=A0A667WGM0_9TELE
AHLSMILVFISMCDAINTDDIFGGPPVSTGTEGGNVKVKCSYTWASDNKKFFCNETCEGKDILIETTQDRYQKGRYIIEDTRNGVFYVTITQLTKSDAGTYYCGVDRAIKDTYGKVKIETGGESQLLNLWRCSPGRWLLSAPPCCDDHPKRHQGHLAHTWSQVTACFGGRPIIEKRA